MRAVVLEAPGPRRGTSHRTYALDGIAQAHADMEHGRATGKLVVVT